MLPNAFATERYLKFLRGLADKQAGRKAGPWEQGCWQAGDLRSVGGRLEVVSNTGHRAGEKIPAKVSDSGGPAPRTWTEKDVHVQSSEVVVPSAPA